MLQTVALGFRQNGVWILEGAGGGDEVIVRHSEAYGVVAEFEGELAGAEELLVDPARVVCVGCHTREPLRDGVDGVAVLFEELVAGACIDAFAVVDRIAPGDLEDEVGAACERFIQIEAQHGFHHGMRQRGTLGIGELGDFHLAIVVFVGQQAVECGVGDLGWINAALGIRHGA